MPYDEPWATARTPPRMDAPGPTDAVVTAAAARRPRRAANLSLGALALLLAAALLVPGGGGPSAPGQDRARLVSAQHAALTRAAGGEALAFLDVDYRDQRRRAAAVLRGATGPFARQYAAGRALLQASTARARAVSAGRLRAVGVGTLTARRAVVLVAADAQVRNASTHGRPQLRHYRLRLTLTREHGRWLTSDLRFVG